MADEKKQNGTDELDTGSVEKTPEATDEKQSGAKPGKKKKKGLTGKNVIKGKSPMFSDADKSKILGIAATVVCIAGLVFFVGWQAISGFISNPPSPALPNTTTQPGDGQQGNGTTGQDDQPEISVDPSSQGSNWTSPFDRSPWNYKLEDEDGNPAADGQNPQVSGGTRYWVKARDGSKEFKIVIPAGYVAADMGDHIEIMSDTAVPVDGDEPMEFWWRYTTEVDSVLKFGIYDTLAKTGTTGYTRWDVIADSYYLFKDENGNEYPVVTATFTKIESEEGVTDPYYEYWLIVGKKSGDGKYLVGTVPVNGFTSLRTQMCPDMEHLAKALFPMSSDPEPPMEWSQPLDYVQTSGDTGDTDQEPGYTDTP